MRSPLALAVLSLTLVVEVASAAPLLWSGSSIVEPGSQVQVHGHGLGHDCRLEVLPRGVPWSDPPLDATTVAASPGVLIARLPTGFDAPMVGVRAVCSNGASPWLRLGRIEVDFSPIERACQGSAFDLYGRFGDPRWPLWAMAERIVDGQRTPLAILERRRFRVRLALPTSLPSGPHRLLLANTADDSGLVTVAADAHPRLCRTPPRLVDPAQRLGVPEADALLHDVVVVDEHPATGLIADGTTDNRLRLQQLIDAIAPVQTNRIAILEIPAGRYALDVVGPGRALRLRRGVFLRGAGTATELVFGARCEGPAQRDQRVFEFETCPQADVETCALHPAGLVDLALESRAHGQYLYPRPPHVGAGIVALNARGIVIANVTYRMGNLDTLQLHASRELLVTRSRFINPTSPWTAFAFTESRYGRILDNTFRYFFGRFESGVQSEHIELRDNRITMDFAAQPNTTQAPHDQCCGGGVQMQAAFRKAIVGNRIEIVNDDPTVANGYIANNHGEMVLAEMHSVTMLHESGIVAAASANALIAAGADWDTEDRYPTSRNGLPNPPPGEVRLYGTVKPFMPTQRVHVAIVDGVGNGQVRRVVGNGRDRLFLDRPWDLPPAVGAKFRIFSPAAESVFVLDNEIVNGPSSVQLDGGLRVVIAGNRGVDSGRIKVEGADLYTPAPATPCRYLHPPGHPLANGMTPERYRELGDCPLNNLLWDVLVLDNELANTNAKYAAAIQVNTAVFLGREPPPYGFAGPTLQGNTVRAVEVRGNRLLAATPRNVKEHETRTLGFRFSADWHWLGHERIYLAVGGSAHGFFNRFDARAIDGVIVSGNVITGIDETEPAHILSHGLGAVAIADPAHPIPGPVCLDLARTTIAPGSLVGLRLSDPARMRARYLESCAQGPRCNDYWRRDEVAMARGRVGPDGRLVIDDPAMGFLVRHWRPLTPQGGFQPLHAPFAIPRAFFAEVVDSDDQPLARGHADPVALVSGCPALGELDFFDGFEDD